MTTFIIMLVFSVIGLGIWNVLELRRMRRFPLRNNEINDKHYWELKYKMQYLLTIFSIVVAIAAYLGINSLDGVKENIRSEIKPTIDSLKLQFENLHALAQRSDTNLTLVEKKILAFEAKSQTMTRSIKMSASDLRRLKDEIDTISSNNKNQALTYIIDRLEIGNPSPNGDWPKVFFKDLKQTNGDALPKFQQPPILNIVSTYGNDASVRNVTTESFEMISMMNTTQEAPPYIFTLIIIYKPFR